MKARIDTARFGVLIVDMQYSFLKNIKPNERDSLIQHQKELLDLCSYKNYPVAVLKFARSGEIISELDEVIKKVPRHRTFIKYWDDGFCENPDLGDTLKKSNIETLCITGVNADCCVLQTIVGAMRNGFKVTTSRELMATQYGQTGMETAEDLLSKRWASGAKVYYPSYERLLLELS